MGANQADKRAWERARRPKPCKLKVHRALAKMVAGKLRRLWSPEQIAGWLKHLYPNDMSCQVSHETIYRTLYIQSRGTLKQSLLAHLRRTRGIARATKRRKQLITGGSRTRYRSVNVPPQSRIERSLATGRRPAVWRSWKPDCDSGRAADPVGNAR